jgi:hypothetical protein
VVLVPARVPKATKYAAPGEGETAAAIVARKLVDKTHARDRDDEHGDDDNERGDDDDSSRSEGE